MGEELNEFLLHITEKSCEQWLHKQPMKKHNDSQQKKTYMTQAMKRTFCFICAGDEKSNVKQCAALFAAKLLNKTFLN